MSIPKQDETRLAADDLETILTIARNGQSGRITPHEVRELVNAYTSTDASNADRNFENAREAWNLVWKREAELSKLKASTDALRSALAELLHAVCGETGFAEAVRRDSGHAYPWPALDIAEEKARAALSGSSEQTK